MRRRLSGLICAGLTALTGCSPGGTPAPTANAPDAADGERIYRGSCMACHQENGAGLPGVYPSLAGSPVVLGDPTALAQWVVQARRPVSMPQGRYATAMPRFGWLKPADAAALLSFLRSHFGNAASPVSADSVALAVGE